MLSRLAWLTAALTLPLLLLVLGGQAAGRRGPASLSGPVIINEWSQGLGGSGEWIEFLVITGPVDLRGWDIGDRSAGDMHFTTAELWAAVPAGTLLVVYNGNDRDGILPPDDADPADCRLIVPHNGGLLTGGWPALANGSDDDNPHLRDAADVTVHDFSSEPGVERHPGAQTAVRFDGRTLVAVSDPAAWSLTAAADATPATGNGGDNDAWLDALGCQAPPARPNVAVAKGGPETAVAGGQLAYTLTVSNGGSLTATGVVVTDTLPVGTFFVADAAVWPRRQPIPGIVAWDVGHLAPGERHRWVLTTAVAVTVAGPITNVVRATTILTETTLADNEATAVIWIDDGLPDVVIIDAVFSAGYENNQPDEAVQLRNVGAGPVDIGGWELNDGGPSTAVVPPGVMLAPGTAVWLTRRATAFERQFGFRADLELEGSDPTRRQLGGVWPGFRDEGDEVILRDGAGLVRDVLVYGNGDPGTDGWVGPALDYYRAGNNFAVDGQILYRRREWTTGDPVSDSDRAADWAQDRGDPLAGRRVRYPGWEETLFDPPLAVTTTLRLTVAVAPDNAFETLVGVIDAAKTSLDIASLTFESVAILDALQAAAGRGVTIRLLLEGAPAGGLSDQSRYVCQALAAAGGVCTFMISEPDYAIYDRYRFVHAKYVIVDSRRAVISSENLSPRSLPDDPKADGTWGRRGVLLVLDAPAVVAHLQALFTADLDAVNHVDVLPWTADHPLYGDRYGAPPDGFIPSTESGGITYPVRYTAPLVVTGLMGVELVQAPDNALRPDSGLLGLVGQAGAGDVIRVQQLGERPYWGAGNSNPDADPNLRLEAYLDAARRGATVRVMLDAYFDDPTSPLGNSATCAYLHQVAWQEHLPLTCTLANPAGLGIHNKMVLARIDGRGTIHLGSINGSEQSHKGNREVAITIQSDGAHAFLAEMFERDWPHQLWLPLVFQRFDGPPDHLLISELLYDPSGADDYEFVEIANPTVAAIDLSGYGVGDATYPTDFEDMRRFPAGATIPRHGTVVVARSAAAFRDHFGFDPDYEIDNSDPAVPDMLDDPHWGDPAATLQWGNGGDEVFLRAPDNTLVDVLVYGAGMYPPIIPFVDLPPTGYSLERYPYWRDSDNCQVDFRPRVIPSPGALP